MNKKRLDQNIVAIIKRLREKTLHPDALNPRLRRKIVAVFMAEDSSASNRQIGELIGLCEAQVGRIKRTMLEKSAYDFETEVRLLLYSMKQKRDEYQRKALREGDVGVAWKIEMDYVEKLQSLGVVFKAPSKIAVANIAAQGGEADDFRDEMRRYLDDHGIPTYREFLARVAAVDGNGNGNGNGNGKGNLRLLEASVVHAPGEGEDRGAPRGDREDEEGGDTK